MKLTELLINLHEGKVVVSLQTVGDSRQRMIFQIRVELILLVYVFQ